MEWFELVLSLFVILGGAELFTNGIEWVGEGFGLSQGAVGSVLAAVGTALPETILPLIAILSGHVAGEEIGIGAILGAPFMLTTLAMFVIAVAVFAYARSNGRSLDLDGDRMVLRQDLGYFLVMYALAMGAGLLHMRAVNWVLAVVLAFLALGATAGTAGLVGLALARTPAAAAGCCAGCGFGLILYLATGQSTLQLGSPDAAKDTA